MTNSPKDTDAGFLAKQAAADALFQQKQAQEKQQLAQQQAQTEKFLADRKAEEAGAPARQAQQDKANNTIVAGLAGAVGIVTGIALMDKLNGVTPMATLSGAQSAAGQGVIQSVAQQGGFTVASPANPEANGPQNVMNTAMAFLTPPKNA